jgi:hypothetical protein
MCLHLAGSARRFKRLEACVCSITATTPGACSLSMQQ